jgi:hypothetical protein
LLADAEHGRYLVFAHAEKGPALTFQIGTWLISSTSGSAMAQRRMSSVVVTLVPYPHRGVVSWMQPAGIP